MKARFTTGALSALFLLVGVSQLGAQSQPRSPGVDQAISQREALRRQLFMDQTATIYAGDVERMNRILTSIKASTYDVNHDGKLDATERAAWEKQLRVVLSRTPEWMRKYDLDHDNILSDAEWEAAYYEMFEAPLPPAAAKK